MAKETRAQDLSDFLAVKNYDVKYTDERGADSAPGEAKVFAFDWVAPNSRKDYGTAVIVLSDEDDLQLFFGDNLGKSMEDPRDKEAWFGFMKQLKDFATRHNIGTFSPLDINQLKHTLSGIAAIKEGLFEGYYGNRRTSYMGEQTQARLVIKHNRMLGENDKRYRYVESLFIETADGECFKLPFTKLVAGRAMLEHVRQGGNTYDIRGQHIKEMVQEMSVLSRFNRASHSKIFEGSTAELVESARGYYQQLQENLKHLTTRRGYSDYFESWTPADINSETQLVEDIKQMFIEQTIDARIEAAVPILARLQQGAKMKEIQVFENWINKLTEGTWALPDTPEAQAALNNLMSRELIVGPDATNATEQLYDVIGDDQLFDILHDLADQDPRANVWDDTDVQRRLAELGIQTPASTAAAPADVAQDTAPKTVAEGRILDESGETLEHILNRYKHELKQFEAGDDLDNDLYYALFDYYSDAGEIPYGIAKGRDGDPYEWITDKLDQELGTGNYAPRLPEADNMATFIEGMPANPGQENSAVARAVTNRILMQRTDLLAKHGPEKVMSAIDEVADFVGNVDEIGSSDVSGWVRQVEQMLGNIKQGMAEGAGANKTHLAMAYLKAVVMAPVGTPEKRRILNWQQILSDQFDIEIDTVTLARMLPQLDSQLKSGQLDRLRNRMASRGELEIGETRQGMEEANDDPINYNAAITGSYYEAKEDPLVRMKSLALRK
jgi:hypothetical protein